MTDEKLVNEADQVGEKIGAFARAHVAALPTAIALAVGWLAREFLPGWVGWVIGGLIVAVCLWVIWAEHRQ